MMTINTEEKVQVRFTIVEGDTPLFSDALYFTPAERAALTDEALAAMQQARYTNWQAACSSLQDAPAPIAEDLAAALDDLNAQRAALDEQIVATSATLAAVASSKSPPVKG